MKKLTALIFLQIILSNLSAQESTLLRLLFDSSDVVVQGVIASTNCIGYSLGVEECSYKVRVDSIYKGSPKIYPIEYIVGFDPDSGPRQNIEIIYFTRDCFIGEKCPGRNQNVILFLKNPKDQNGYILSDSWLGFQQYNYPLSFELGRLRRISDEK